MRLSPQGIVFDGLQSIAFPDERYKSKCIKEPLNKSMIGIRAPEVANYFVAPQGHFFSLPSGNLQGAKFGNIPDIPCVMRLVFDPLRGPTARPGLIQRFLK